MATLALEDWGQHIVKTYRTLKQAGQVLVGGWCMAPGFTPWTGPTHGCYVLQFLESCRDKEKGKNEN